LKRVLPRPVRIEGHAAPKAEDNQMPGMERRGEGVEMGSLRCGERSDIVRGQSKEKRERTRGASHSISGGCRSESLIEEKREKKKGGID